MNRKLVLNNDLRVSGKTDLQNTNDATSCTDANAALRVAGGVAIGKKLFACGDVDFGSNLVVDGTSRLSGEVRVDTGIVPDTDEGAYLGSTAKPFSEAHIGEIRIGNGTNDNEIDTATGGLTLDSASGTTTVDDNLVVTGNLDVDGTTELDGLNVDGNTTLDNTTIDGTVTLNGNLNAGTNTITASTFAGTASNSNTTLVNATNSGTWNLALVNGTGFRTIHRDTNISFNASNNTLSTAGDIIAFASDDRLKTNKVGITNALDKVNSLSGFTYNFNETAGEFGFSTEIDYVGVSAQEVEAVLPEAVHPAPIGNGYKTVQYEKIVPLLIEAIKELSDKVSSLEDKLNN
jgi:cytoskeletal protein CcmA (bactofilin family)